MLSDDQQYLFYDSNSNTTPISTKSVISNLKSHGHGGNQAKGAGQL
jgi:hypothetical protein